MYTYVTILVGGDCNELHLLEAVWEEGDAVLAVTWLGRLFDDVNARLVAMHRVQHNLRRSVRTGKAWGRADCSIHPGASSSEAKNSVNSNRLHLVCYHHKVNATCAWHYTWFARNSFKRLWIPNCARDILAQDISCTGQFARISCAGHLLRRTFRSTDKQTRHSQRNILAVQWTKMSEVQISMHEISAHETSAHELSAHETSAHELSASHLKHS